MHKQPDNSLSVVETHPSIQPILSEVRRCFPFFRDSRRIFHGRGHSFSGLEDVQVDWFSPVLLVTVYRHFSEAWLTHLSDDLRELVKSVQAIYVQERFHLTSPTRLFWGESPDTIEAVEAGLKYQLRLGTAQNVGFFLDMAVGRKLVSGLAAKKRVLNLFAYTCSFSVAALTSGAEQVINLDMNRGALELGRLNHQLNGIDLRQTSFLPLEFFRSIGKLRKLAPFDLVICDPPATQGKSFNAERDWAKLLRKIGPLIAPGGDIVACLNAPHLAPEFLTGLFAEFLPQAALLETLEPGTDFPEKFPARGVWIFHYRTKAYCPS